MAEYIEKGAAKYAVDLAMDLSDTEYDAICNSIDKVHSADVAPVVRCKDCKYAYINSFSAVSGVALCKHWSNEAKTAIMQQDDFCSYGERRTDEALQKLP